jgi:hypothetical protein
VRVRYNDVLHAQLLDSPWPWAVVALCVYDDVSCYGGIIHFELNLAFTSCSCSCVRACSLHGCYCRIGKVTVGLCKAEAGSNGAEAVGKVLPVLIDEGLLSRVKEIRAIALGVMLEVAKEAGPALRPHLVEFLMVLLEALSGMENPVLDYVNTRLDGATRHQVSVLHYLPRTFIAVFNLLTVCFYSSSRMLRSTNVDTRLNGRTRRQADASSSRRSRAYHSYFPYSFHIPHSFLCLLSSLHSKSHF